MKGLTKDQKWLYQQIMKICKDKKVVDMSYEDLFLTLDRVKFCYVFGFCVRDKATRDKLKKSIEREEGESGEV